MPDLTPIPTAYNGHHFRSRLEARWAVFFDALGWRYEYEAEGYDLGGTWYLPDFWFPDLGIFVEVKPASAEDLTGPDVLLNVNALHLAIRSRRWVLVIYGQPWPGEYGIALHGRDLGLTFRMDFALSSHPGEVWLVGSYGGVCLNPYEDKRGSPLPDSPLLDDAYRAARSARFEHGESGRTL